MGTQRYIPAESGACLVVLEAGKVRVYMLDARPEWRIGRSTPEQAYPPDISFASGIVSREHGMLQRLEDQWYYVDNPNNLNGTFYNGTKIPRPTRGVKRPTPLKDGDVLRVDNEDLNHTDSNGVLMLFTTANVSGQWTAVPLGNRTTVIGRDSDCTIVEDLPYISAKHAMIECRGGRYYLSDCNSRGGTFLNGSPVTSPTLLREKDHITLCDRQYFVVGDSLLYPRCDHRRSRQDLMFTRPQERPVILSADIQSKKVNISKMPLVKKEKELLRDVKLQIREGNLVAILGTAGAGKSTLMGCLSGIDRKGVTGSVVYRGVDLIRNLDRIKYLIGNVPQEKVIRPELTPEKAFMESAQLRLSAEIGQEEIRKRVADTLELLSMTKVKDTLNSQLSGGEKTRVNVGIDLVADRDIYFLDEPEQGLSPNLRDELYVFLRELAHTHGKTIVAIIHDVSCIDMFDQVIFLVKANGVGRLAFSGSPEEGEKRFGVPIGKAYALLEANPEQYVQ